MTEVDKTTNNNRKRTKKRITILVSVIVIAILGGLTFWQFTHDSNPDSKTKGQQIIKRVGELYMLPSEEPVVAEIKDKTKLSEGQTFDNKAQNGDYVLLYNAAKIALLYRESTGKLVSVKTISSNQTAPQAN